MPRHPATTTTTTTTMDTANDTHVPVPPRFDHRSGNIKRTKKDTTRQDRTGTGTCERKEDEQDSLSRDGVSHMQDLVVESLPNINNRAAVLLFLINFFFFSILDNKIE